MAKPISSTAIPSYDDVDKHKMFVCPYNECHRISALIYPSHVSTCRKQYTGKKFSRCPFNARHEFPSVEYEYHISTCPDKNIIENELVPASAPNVPPVNHFPVWNEPSPTEDWDAEADRAEFSITGRTDGDQRTAFDVIEEFQDQLEEKTLSQVYHEPPGNRGDTSGLSKAQKKNLKRRQKKRGLQIQNGHNDDDVDDDDDGDDQYDSEITTEDQEKAKLAQIAKEYSLPGRSYVEDAFVDWVSILNIYCQKNKINVPKYSEAPNPLGGFGASVVVASERFFSNRSGRTKKEAKHHAARAALLGLNIAVSSPAVYRGVDAQRSRELEERGQMIRHRMGLSNQPRVIPGHNPASALPQRSPPRAQTSSANETSRITNQMAGLRVEPKRNTADTWQTVGKKPRDRWAMAGRGLGRGRPSS